MGVDRYLDLIGSKILDRVSYSGVAIKARYHKLLRDSMRMISSEIAEYPHGSAFGPFPQNLRCEGSSWAWRARSHQIIPHCVGTQTSDVFGCPQYRRYLLCVVVRDACGTPPYLNSSTRLFRVPRPERGVGSRRV